MKSFLVKLIFNINVAEGENQSEFDEQVRVVNAQDRAEALNKAHKIGREEEEIFINANNELVHWQFIDVCDIYLIDETTDGARLFSSTHKFPDFNSYIAYIREKSKQLHNEAGVFS